MKVCLLADVKGQGKRDDIINASDGYARNYLIPRKLAVELTPAVKREIEERAAQRRRIEEQERADARALAAKLESALVRLTLNTGADGKIYGSVTAKDICDALAAQTGIELERHRLVLNEAIKSFGTFELKVKIYADITGTVNVLVTEK